MKSSAEISKIYESASPEEMPSQDFKGVGRPRIYPFFDMEVGQVVVIKDPMLRQSARNSAQHVSRMNGWKFKTVVSSDGRLFVKRTS